jgi:hypothetical protein
MSSGGTNIWQQRKTDMRQIAGPTNMCFAEKCPVRLFTNYGVSMEAVLKSIADNEGSGPGPSGQPRYWYASDINRCYCLDHGRQYIRLAKDLPLALQELSALASLYPDYRTKLSELDPSYQNVQRAEDRVAHLRQLEAELVPLEPEENVKMTTPASFSAVHNGMGCTTCLECLYKYERGFLSLANREPLATGLMIEIRSQLCDEGKKAFDRFVCQSQDPTSRSQS